MRKIHYGQFVMGIILGLSFLFAFSEIILWIIKGWFTFTQPYSLVIFIISIYMVWFKKDHLKKLSVNPRLFSGMSLTILGCMFLILGKLSSTLIIQGVALVFTLLGLVLLIFGKDFFSVLFIPVGYMLLMFSLIEELLGNISIYFQNTTAWIAAHLLDTYGMPVLLSNQFIELPHITLEVAKVCNGINHIVALVALAIPLAIMRQRSTWQKILYILSAFIIGLFANGLRVALIGIWTVYNKNPESIHGPFEMLYVSFILIFGLALLVILGLFAKRKDADESVQTEEQSARPTGVDHPNRLPLLPLVAASIILFLVSSYIHAYKPVPVNLDRPLGSFPQRIGRWHGKDVNDENWPFKNHIADEKLKRMYKEKDGSKYNIGLYIAYYSSQNQKSEIINDNFSWLYNKANDQFIHVDSKKISIKKGLPRGLPDQTYQGDQRSFYFWYEIDRKILTDRYKTKLVTLLNSIVYKRSNGAMILVTVNDKWSQNHEANDHAVKFIEAAYPYIQKHLKTGK